MELENITRRSNVQINKTQSKVISKKIIVYLLAVFISNVNLSYAQTEEQPNIQIENELENSINLEQPVAENELNVSPLTRQHIDSEDIRTSQSTNPQQVTENIITIPSIHSQQTVIEVVIANPKNLQQADIENNLNITSQFNDPYEQIIDKKFYDKIQNAIYREENVSELLSSDQGLLWLKSNKGKTWLASNEGKNWLQSDSSIVRQWLSTDNAQAWVLSPQGEQAMLLAANSLSDNKILTLTNNFSWPGISSLFAYTTLTAIVIVLGRNIDSVKTEETVANAGANNNPKAKEPLPEKSTPTNENGFKYVLTIPAVLTISVMAANILQGIAYSFTSFQSPIDKLLSTKAGNTWLYTESGIKWLLTPSGLKWLEFSEGQDYLHFFQGNKNGYTIAKSLIHKENLNQAHDIANKMEKVFLQKVENANHISGWWYDSDLDQFLSSYVGGVWLATETGIKWLQTPQGKLWQSDRNGRMKPIFINWLNKDVGLQAIKQSAELQRLIFDYVIIMDNHDFSNWYFDSEFANFLSSKAGSIWITTIEGQRWIKHSRWQEWLKDNLKNSWIFKNYAIKWFDTPIAEIWTNTPNGQQQLKTIIGQWSKNERKDGIYVSDYSTIMQTKVGKMYNYAKNETP